jgi:5-methylcytosine-specific restriction endonuclease McrA
VSAPASEPAGPEERSPQRAGGSGGFIRTVTDAEMRREKDKARQLRATAWWRRRLAQGRCDYCGRPTPPRDLTMDHRVPLVRGGRSTKGNLAAACKACNSAKRYLLPTEWDAHLARLGMA